MDGYDPTIIPSMLKSILHTEQLEVVVNKKDQEAKDTLSAAQELHEKELAQLHAQIESLKASVSSTSEDKSSALFEFKKKKKALKAQWKRKSLLFFQAFSFC